VDIEFRRNGRKWIAEVWSLSTDSETYPEEEYVEINNWCISTLGYHARTAYHVFEFKKQSDLEWFILRWQ
jgi:hypothetical protein